VLNLARQKNMSHRNIDSAKWYPASQAAVILAVTTETVKKYCRRQVLKGKQVGPKKMWHVWGSSISRLRQQWRIDE
jgi:hypothetical protein